MFKNYIFQIISLLVNIFIPRKTGSGVSLVDYSKRMIVKMRLSKIFSGKKMLIIGDSNAENMSSFQDLNRFGKYLQSIVINIGVGGTKADDWLDFLENTNEGKKIYEIAKDFDIVLFNLGGNNVLQNKMSILEKSLIGLKDMFPNSFNCTIPPLHYDLLEPQEEKQKKNIQKNIQKNVLLANKIIKDIWKEKTLDLYNLFVDSEGKPYIFTLEDAVHFSQFADKNIRIPYISFCILVSGTIKN